MAAASGELRFITVGEGKDSRRIAMRIRQAADASRRPLLVWLGGYRSDMNGTKALEIDRYAERQGLGCLRFDYSGHGESGGDFTEGTISRWVEEALAVIQWTQPADILLVGSSMGCWIALRLVERLKASAIPIRGLVLIAPAPDFTSDLIEPGLTSAQKQMLQDKGYFERSFDDGQTRESMTRKFLDDGRQNRVLTGVIDISCPVHILQGMQDEAVPYHHALKLMEHLPTNDVVMTLIRDGDHRLSRPEDMTRILDAISALAG
jgi:pimeloyl-ACP methyl ester carboxylesterase